MTAHFDFIVVGSGPSGAMAAQTLVEAGRQVAMIDVGVKGRDYESMLPPGGYLDVRRSDADQHRYLLGDAFESVEWDDVKVGAQLTPARKHLPELTQEYAPLISETFAPMESLAYGGLGAGWGLGTYVYSDDELDQTGLDAAAMEVGYQVVCDRIGISAAVDDVTRHVVGRLRNTQAPLEMDNSARRLLAAYGRRRSTLNRRGFYLGHPALALLTSPVGDRAATRYDDMDFYSDRDRAAYRPWLTVESLRSIDGFTYLGRQLVLRFSEDEANTSVEMLDLGTQQRRVVTCRRLVLAAGALGSARIAMRSFGDALERVPLLCNPYTYQPCLHVRMLGTPLSERKTSMAQAFMIFDENNTGRDVVSMALYTYRSLMLHRIIKQVPLPFGDGLRIFARLQSALMIAGIHHPDAASDEKFLRRVPHAESPTGDAVHASYSLSGQERAVIARKERAVRRALAGLGCLPLGPVTPRIGASIHYAGTLPFVAGGPVGTTARNGRLNGTRGVFVADGSGLRHLPAKGITLTLMANAHLTARAALR